MSWRGFAFENLCFTHIDQIKKALGIVGVYSEQYAWTKKTDDTLGAQIDMLINRDDNVINMCEVKFYSDEFTVNKDYHMILQRRVALLQEKIPKRKIVHNTLITTYGLKYHEYSGDFLQVVTLDDLFKL